jgi:uncharacterized Zn-binding protein involved in type VI secretion
MPGLARAFDRSECNTDHAVGVASGKASPDVLVNGRSPLFMSSRGIYGACCGRAAVLWVVSQGSQTVLINGEPAAGLGSATTHQAGKGVLIDASPDVLIGGPAITMEELARADALAMLDKGEAALRRWNSQDRQYFKHWFGLDTEHARQQMLARTRAMRTLIKTVDFVQFDGHKNYAHTFRHGPIYLESGFWKAPRTGRDSRAGTLIHEASHYTNAGHTLDVEKNAPDSERLARGVPPYAIEAANNNEYYFEHL